MLMNIILSTAFLLAIAAFLLLLCARRRLEMEPAFLHFILIETAFGLAIAIFAEGWTRLLGFVIGVVSVIECTHCFSKTARHEASGRPDNHQQ